MNSWSMYALYLSKVLLLRSQFTAAQWLNLLPYTLNLKTFSHSCKVAVYCGSLSTTCFSCGLLYGFLPPHITVGLFPFWNWLVMTSQKTAAFTWLYSKFFYFFLLFNVLQQCHFFSVLALRGDILFFKALKLKLLFYLSLYILMNCFP